MYVYIHFNASSLIWLMLNGIARECVSYRWCWAPKCRYALHATNLNTNNLFEQLEKNLLYWTMIWAICWYLHTVKILQLQRTRIYESSEHLPFHSNHTIQQELSKAFINDAIKSNENHISVALRFICNRIDRNLISVHPF